MSLFGALRKGFQRLFGGDLSQPPESARVERDASSVARSPRSPREPAIRARGRVPKDDLPAGWNIAGLWTEGKGLTHDPVPSDRDIERADGIVVSYTDALGVDYRTIHGARTRKQVGDLIRKVTLQISPPR